jgi:heterodisulfide reductase subunit C
MQPTAVSSAACYQCQKCSSGCPVASFMDIKPHQIMQMAGLGMKDELLRSSAIWLCLSCYTCSTRCPNDVNVAGIIDDLRSQALAKKIPAAERSIAAFHEAFLKDVHMWGRTHELSVMMLLNGWDVRRYLEDTKWGLKLFLKGKVGLMPSIPKGRKQVKLMFTERRPSRAER